MVESFRTTVWAVITREPNGSEWIVHVATFKFVAERERDRRRVEEGGRGREHVIRPARLELKLDCKERRIDG